MSQMLAHSLGETNACTARSGLVDKVRVLNDALMAAIVASSIKAKSVLLKAKANKRHSAMNPLAQSCQHFVRLPASLLHVSLPFDTGSDCSVRLLSAAAIKGLASNSRPIPKA